MKLAKVKFLFFLFLIGCGPSLNKHIPVVHKIHHRKSLPKTELSRSQIKVQKIFYLDTADRIDCLEITTDGKYLVASDKERISIWDLELTSSQSPTQIYTEEAAGCCGKDFEHSVSDLSISQDNKKIAYVFCGCYVGIADLLRGEIISKWKMGESWIKNVTFLNDGRLFVATQDGGFGIWDLEKLDPVSTRIETGVVIDAIRFSNTVGGSVVSWSGIQLDPGRDPITVVNIFNYATGEINEIVLDDEKVESIDISPNGSKLAASESCNQQILLWDLEKLIEGYKYKRIPLYETMSTKNICKVENDSYYPNIDDTFDIQYITDELLVLNGPNREISIFDIKKGQEIAELREGGTSPARISVSLKRKLVAAAYDAHIEIWKIN